MAGYILREDIQGQEGLFNSYSLKDRVPQSQLTVSRSLGNLHLPQEDADEAAVGEMDEARGGIELSTDTVDVVAASGEGRAEADCSACVSADGGDRLSGAPQCGAGSRASEGINCELAAGASRTVRGGTVLPNISLKTETNLLSRKKKQRRRLQRLHMLVQNMVILVLEGQFRAPHDFKLAQVLKTHGTVGEIIDFFADLGYCMTESIRRKRERRVAETRKDEAQVVLDVESMAFVWDNCDHETCRGVHEGGRHISVVACFGIIGSSRLVRLCTFHGHRRQKDMTLENIMEGVSWPRDGEHWGVWSAAFEKAAHEVGVKKIESKGGDIDTYLEVEL